MTDSVNKKQDNLHPYKLIPEEILIKLSGEQALAVLLCLASFTKQGLELGLITPQDWLEREKTIKIFLEATNCHVQCPKTFVKNFEEIMQDIGFMK